MVDRRPCSRVAPSCPVSSRPAPAGGNGSGGLRLRPPPVRLLHLRCPLTSSVARRVADHLLCLGGCRFGICGAHRRSHLTLDARCDPSLRERRSAVFELIHVRQFRSAQVIFPNAGRGRSSPFGWRASVHEIRPIFTYTARRTSRSVVKIAWCPLRITGHLDMSGTDASRHHRHPHRFEPRTSRDGRRASRSSSTCLP